MKLLQPLVVPEGAEAVLWALPKDGAPFRLGVLRTDAKQVITMAGTSEALLAAVGELAVSIEPVGAARRLRRGRRAASCCAAIA